MPIHDLIADHVPSVLRAAARAVVSVARFLFVYVLTNILLFNLGRVALLIATLGRYPQGRALALHKQRIVTCGCLLLVLVWCGIALFNHFRSLGA